MLEKHHLGQAVDLHYNINGKLLELKGWCEVIQPAPSYWQVASPFPTPGSRQAQGTLSVCGTLAYFCRSAAPPLHPPHPPPCLFLNMHAHLFSNATSPHTCSSLMVYAPVSSLSDVIFSEPSERHSNASRCTGNKETNTEEVVWEVVFVAYRQIIKLLYVSSYINSAHTLRQNSQLIFPGLQFLPVPKTCKCIFHIQFCESRGKGDLCMFYCILYISAFSPTFRPSINFHFKKFLHDWTQVYSPDFDSTPTDSEYFMEDGTTLHDRAMLASKSCE